MEIKSVYDEEFKEYGRVLMGYEGEELIAAMNTIPMPEDGVAYEPTIASLEACKVFGELADSFYGGMPMQLGMCWGYNTKLNCLEYHRDSEINMGTGDFVLLLAKQHEMKDYMLDTSTVKAFMVPAGVFVEVYGTTLHYAPCEGKKGEGFRVLVALPKGTNTDKPVLNGNSPEDKYLTARNKWLLPHPDSSEAKGGAVVGLYGINIDIADNI